MRATLTLTADEIMLLREMSVAVGYLIAEPDYTIESWCSAGGGGTPTSWTEPSSGFRHSRADRGALTGEWRHRHIESRFGPDARPDLAGRPSRYRFDNPHRHVRITHGRLVKWAESLPAHIRYRAIFVVTWHRQASVHPVAKLRDITRTALAATPVKAELATQLDLFEVAS